MDIRKLFDAIPKRNDLLSFGQIQEAIMDWYRVCAKRSRSYSFNDKDVFIDIDGLHFIAKTRGYGSDTAALEPLNCFNIFSLNTGYPYRSNVAYAISVRRCGNRLNIIMNNECFSRTADIDPTLKDSDQQLIACLEKLRSELDKLDNECGRTTRAAYRYTPQKTPKIVFDDESTETEEADETETEKEASND